MRCSDCKKFKTSECEINPTGEDHESVEQLGCFVPRDYGEIDRDTSAKVSPILEVSEKTISPDEIKRIYEEENTKLEALEDKQKQGAKTTRIGCLVLIIIAVAIVVGIALCGGPTFDEEGINKVVAYAEEIIPAVDAGIFLIYTTDDFDELWDAAQKIWQINDRHLTSDFPDNEEIEKWGWHRTVGGTTWDVNGKELADAYLCVEFGSIVVAYVLEWLATGEISIDDEYVTTAVSTQGCVDELRWILYRQ